MFGCGACGSGVVNNNIMLGSFAVEFWHGAGEESGWIFSIENFVGNVFLGYCWYVCLI